MLATPMLMHLANCRVLSNIWPLVDVIVKSVYSFVCILMVNKYLMPLIKITYTIHGQFPLMLMKNMRYLKPPHYMNRFILTNSLVYM